VEKVAEKAVKEYLLKKCYRLQNARDFLKQHKGENNG